MHRLVVLVFGFCAAATHGAAPAVIPVTSGTTARETRRTSQIAPGSAITPAQARAAAAKLQQVVPGTMIYTVKPTGSMRPLFDGNCLLLTEPANYDDLAIGDIVVYRHSRTGARVVHRILEKRRGGYWTKGDHNNRMDDELVTSENYEARIYGIIYLSRSDHNQTPEAVTAMNLMADTR